MKFLFSEMAARMIFVSPLVTIAAPVSPAQTFTTLYSFTGVPDGAKPVAGLLQDAQGNLYGTTSEGGNVLGVVFRLDTTGQETVLHNFAGGKSDGLGPLASLIRDVQGNLYGTTQDGGNSTCNQGRYCGMVFKLSSAGKLTALHAFTGGADGSNPSGELIRDARGNFYGTAMAGGNPNCSFGSFKGCGTVFEITKTGKFTLLYSFKGGKDGANPVAGLVRDGSGNLYGTTYSGGGHSVCGDECGTVFKLSKTGHETLLHRFAARADGAFPSSTLVLDEHGNLYGTTRTAGRSRCHCGTIFKVNSKGNFTVLHAFKGGKDGDGKDGDQPDAGLIRDATGNLYGTTYFGGPNNTGTIFKLDKNGNEAILYSFTSDDGQGNSDGAGPAGRLLLDANGNLYGTAFYGGHDDVGTVFKLTIR
jgi:uncharacterized repeat protein (TIGR03803 family)